MAANVAHRIGDHRRYGSGYYAAAIRDKTADAAENGAGDASGSGNGGNGSLRPGFRAGRRQAYANAAGPYGRGKRAADNHGQACRHPNAIAYAAAQPG